MALTVGSRLGHYDVTAPLGAGGMGEVYQATDTQLDRDVALGRRRFLAAALGLWTMFPACVLSSQGLLTARDIVRLPSPPPEHRIAYGEDPLQFGHLRLPSGPGPHPVVVFLHGGCWLSQYDIAHAGPLEQAIADSGYAVWSIEYRRVGNEGGGWPNTFLDVGRGADYLRVRLMRETGAVAAETMKRLVTQGHAPRYQAP